MDPHVKTKQQNAAALFTDSPAHIQLPLNQFARLLIEL